MKFKIPVGELQAALRLVKDLRLTTGPLAETNAVLLSVSPDATTMTAYNGDALVRTGVKIEADFVGDVVFDAAELYSAVSGFKVLNEDGFGTSDIAFSVSDTSRTITLSAKTKYTNNSVVPHKRKFPLLSREAFPEFTGLDALKTTFTLKAAYLTDGIDRAAYALSGDKNNLLFTGFLVSLEPDKLGVVATNGICLAEYSIPVQYAEKPLQVVVPGALAGRIAKYFEDDEEVEVCISTRHFFVRTPRLLIGGPLIREDFPNYSDVIAPPVSRVTVDKSMLVENLANLAYDVMSDTDGRVTLMVDNGRLLIKAGESENSEIEVNGQVSISVDCNLRHLVASVRPLYGERVELGFSTALHPIHFFSSYDPAAAASLSSILVPLRPDVL